MISTVLTQELKQKWRNLKVMNIFKNIYISILYNLCHISKGMFYILNRAVVLLFAGFMDLKSKNDWLGFLLQEQHVRIWSKFGWNFFSLFGEKLNVNLKSSIQSEAMVQYITWNFPSMN